ncbi:uncharacterized protein STEHIDRAFT_66589 [Stereum hirsutum FP-91666 SS1]|uniref:uncharacterized protein n=1 Tax=Stereum hirsutum (strain FP-91666) TaxID=721885 RepID=UPI0004449AF0|nr:uncharacterized protein STEHIDRAFT_66589 [Stereum hirsutum FP-91666 SS1]EIM81441.1 hypothetical protein STEHIDRAFT_66589 [Stereum hirsutum FP-91666 SS1]
METQGAIEYWDSLQGHVEGEVKVQEEVKVSFKTNNLTDEVGWDGYSLFVRGQRIFLHSGEFHTFRLPVPSLWPDILQKFTSAGLNSVSLYTHWGLLQPSPTSPIDFESFRALAPFYQACLDAGLWVVLRPGPYINAETSAGGIAHWATSEVGGGEEGRLRGNGSEWMGSWREYVGEVMRESRGWQVTEGGPIIGAYNEYDEDGYGNREYFQAVEDLIKESGIVVPLTYNDPNQGKNFVNGTGSVDIYGLDAYPQRFDCSHPDIWNPVTENYHDYHMDTNPDQPFYLPEFQAGAFDAWGPSAPGYDNCRQLTGPEFESVFYKGLWAANAKMISYYMVYGGTSWGAIPFPGVYTSYDYGSAIKENRELTPKYDELKLQGLFLRSSPEFYKTDVLGNSSVGSGVKGEGGAFVVKLRNPGSGAGFWIARQANSSDTSLTQFTLEIDPISLSSSLQPYSTSLQPLTLTIPQILPSISLAGRQSKVIVTDYTFGASSKVLYSTAEVMFAGVIGGRDVLLVYGDAVEGDADADGAGGSEIALWFKGTGDLDQNLRSREGRVVYRDGVEAGKLTTVAFMPGIRGMVTVFDSEEQLVMYADKSTAATFWAPDATGTTSTTAFPHFWGLGTNSTILVSGPYLVRNATLTPEGILELRGDLKEGVMLGVVGPRGVRGVRWNGMEVESLRNTDMENGRGGFVGSLNMRNLRADTAGNGMGTGLGGIEPPVLENWMYMDSLPEVMLGEKYNDEMWVEANKTQTNIPWGMRYTDGEWDGRVLYGCDYGFCENIVIWRGHFDATSETRSVNLSINGGEAFAASVFLNSHFLNTSYGNSTNNNNIIGETDEVFYFPEDALVEGQDNVITIVQDNMGLEETEGKTTDSSRSPRGVRGFRLNSGNFTSWKVQGKIGGYNNFPDKHRGIFNEGGLYGERLGWHLPSYDTSFFSHRDLSAGLPGDKAGVGFFVTTFEMDLPGGFDVMMSFEFADPTGAGGEPYRAFLFVNGWMMGERVANLGPQAKFPVHEGILDYHGINTVAVALWAMESVHVSPQLSVKIDAVLDGGVGGVVVDNPPWSDERYRG